MTIFVDFGKMFQLLQAYDTSKAVLLVYIPMPVVSVAIIGWLDFWLFSKDLRK